MYPHQHQATDMAGSFVKRTTPASDIVKILAMLILVSLCGCSHALRGGPTSTMNIATVVPAMTLAGDELDKSADAETRNKVINRRLMLIDQAYADYVVGLRIEKTSTDLYTGLAGLAIGVAGTLTGGVTAKTNYAAAGTLLAGGAALADKSLYYEQTVLALVAAMDASRSAQRLGIYKEMEKDIEDYTSSKAYQDLISYERAGTLLSAIGYVQSTAKNSQDKTEGEIRDIVKLTPDQRNKKTCSSRGLFIGNPQRTHDRLLAAADALKINVDDTEKNDDEKIAAKIRQFNRDSTASQSDDIYTVLKDKGLIVSCP